MTHTNPHYERVASRSFCYYVPIMDELSEHLDALARDDCYRVDSVIKQSPYETTQLVYFVGANGSEQGPFIRKYLDGSAGLGAAYDCLWKAQHAGKRFLHLPRILDCYSAGPRRAVVMEYIQGETLADVVYRCDPSIALACDVFPKLCEAVRELHESFNPPLIHRDLKPSNIMLSRDSLTLIDFGIARSFDKDADEDTYHFGTRAYAPPEQFGYGQSDVRTDVYALGLLLYFCLTEKTPDAKAKQQNYQNEAIPEPIRKVIEHATAFDPQNRYESVRSLETAFAEAQLQMKATLNAEVSANTNIDTNAMPQDSRNSSSLLDGSVYGAQQTVERHAERLKLSPLGVLWDIFLLLTFVLFLVVATDMVISPKPSYIAYAGPVITRALAYYGIVVFMIAPTLFLVSDRRPLVRFIPALGRISLKIQVVACILLFAFGFVLVAIAATLLPSS